MMRLSGSSRFPFGSKDPSGHASLTLLLTGPQHGPVYASIPCQFSFPSRCQQSHSVGASNLTICFCFEKQISTLVPGQADVLKPDNPWKDPALPSVPYPGNARRSGTARSPRTHCPSRGLPALPTARGQCENE